MKKHRPHKSETTGGNGRDPLVDLLSKYKAAVTELDHAHDHRDSVTPPWPRMSVDDLTDEVIEKIEADHLKIPLVAEAQAKMDAAASARDSILDQMLATAAKTARGLAAKVKAATDAPDDYAEALLDSVFRDAEALPA